MALWKQLPQSLPPAQVRSALTAVIRKSLECPGTFDEAGWLRTGLCGYQPALGDVYVSTGSLYLCTAVFLPLGLPSEDEFWSAPDMPWTAKRIWAGHDMEGDHALD